MYVGKSSDIGKLNCLFKENKYNNWMEYVNDVLKLNLLH